MKLLVNLIACIAAIFLMQILLPDMIQYSEPLVVVVAGLILWIVNTLIRPIIKILTLPLTLLTLGLFSLVINTLLVMLVDALVGGLSLSGFWAALILAVIVSVVQMAIGRLFREERKSKR